MKPLGEYGGRCAGKELEDLLTLAGVGRKTANVIRGNIYHVPSIVVDTHVKRISRKLGLTKARPEKIEADLEVLQRSLDPLEYPYHHWDGPSVRPESQFLQLFLKQWCRMRAGSFQKKQKNSATGNKIMTSDIIERNASK